jgi:hypothetical protein
MELRMKRHGDHLIDEIGGNYATQEVFTTLSATRAQRVISLYVYCKQRAGAGPADQGRDQRPRAGRRGGRRSQRKSHGQRPDNAVNLQPFKYATGAAIPAGCAKNAQGAPVYNANITDAAGKDLGNVCYGSRGIDANGNSINQPDGQPDGFPDAERVYRAVELELNKRFSKGWQLLSNWRIASLRGNSALGLFVESERALEIHAGGRFLQRDQQPRDPAL